MAATREASTAKTTAVTTPPRAEPMMVAATTRAIREAGDTIVDRPTGPAAPLPPAFRPQPSSADPGAVRSGLEGGDDDALGVGGESGEVVAVGGGYARPAGEVGDGHDEGVDRQLRAGGG